MDKTSFPVEWLKAFGKFSLDFFVVGLGASTKVLYKAGSSTSYFGYPEKAFVDQIEGYFGDIIVASDQRSVLKAIEDAKETKSDIEVEFHLIRFDRSLSLVKMTGSYLYSQGDQLVYLFLISDVNNNHSCLPLQLASFRISFDLNTGALIEANMQGRIAFLVHEFANIYEAITIFSSRYVHPQDRKVFAPFFSPLTLCSSTRYKEEQTDISFRRTSYNEAFTGYRWSQLSYSIHIGDSASVCTLVIQDSDKGASQLAQKTLETQLDPLTGALNRLALEKQVTDQIALCSGQHTLGAFFMLDIDQFKWVNDSFGHDSGDEVLRQVAKAVKGVFRPTDIVARPGGDEFAVFITGIPSYELAITKAEGLCQALRTLKSEKKDLRISCSVGVSIFPEHGRTFGELYHTSDLALYQAKRAGKDRYCLYGVQPILGEREKLVDRQWLFSQMEEEIYLCNVDTSELLYANESLRTRLGLTVLDNRRQCYEVLHGRSSPCEDCMNLHLEKGQVRTRLRMDKKTGVLFFLREKALLLRGERVKLSVSTPLPQEWKDYIVQHSPESFAEELLRC